MNKRYAMLFGGFAIIGLGILIANATHVPAFGFGIGMIGGMLVGKS